MNSIIDAIRNETFAIDPGLFFRSLSRELKLSSPPYPGLNMAQGREWAEEVGDGLRELGYGPSPVSGPGLMGTRAPLSAFKKEAGLEQREDLDLEVSDRLTDFLEFEGEADDLEFSEPLGPESRGLPVRILQYRLKKLGFFHQEVDGIFDSHTLDAVMEFKRSFGLALEPAAPGLVDQDLLAMLGNPFGLSRKIYERLQGQPLVLNLALPLAFMKTALSRHHVKVGTGGTSKDQFVIDPLIPSTKEHVSKMKELRESPENRVGLALLQFRLWMLSFYDGPVDGIFGEKSLKALRSFLCEHNSGERDEGKFLVYITGGYVLIAPGIFSLFGFDRPGPQETQDYADAVSTSLDGLLAKSEKGDASPLLLKNGALSAAWSKARELFRGLYRGAKSVVVFVGKSIAKGAIKLWHETLCGFERPGLHLMSQALARIKKALACFWQSLKRFYQFLRDLTVRTSRKNNVMDTRFQRDFDCLNLISIEDPAQAAADAKQHLRQLRLNVRDFAMACDIVGATIGLAGKLLSGPIGWLRLALRVVSTIYQILGKYGKKPFTTAGGEWA